MSSHRFNRIISLALAVGALTAPAAVARDMRMPDTRDAAADARQHQDLRNVDQREAAVSQDFRGADAMGAPTEGSAGVVVLKAPAAEPASGIDWGDAGIGAGGLLGLSLIGLGGTLVVLHRRHGTTVTR